MGKRNLESALEHQQLKDSVDVEWKPFFLDVNAKEGTLPIAEHIEQKYGPGAGKRMNLSLNAAGKAVGIAFTPDRTTHNTVLSHRLVHLAGQQGKQDAAIEALFSAYFEHGAKISDAQVLLGIADKAGVTGAKEYLESDQDRDTLLEEYQEGVRKYRITGVPYFIIGKQGSEEVITLSGAQPPAAFETGFETLSEQDQ